MHVLHGAFRWLCPPRYSQKTKKPKPKKHGETFSSTTDSSSSSSRFHGKADPDFPSALPRHNSRSPREGFPPLTDMENSDFPPHPTFQAAPEPFPNSGMREWPNSSQKKKLFWEQQLLIPHTEVLLCLCTFQAGTASQGSFSRGIQVQDSLSCPRGCSFSLDFFAAVSLPNIILLFFPLCFLNGFQSFSFLSFFLFLHLPRIKKKRGITDWTGLGGGHLKIHLKSRECT